VSGWAWLALALAATAAGQVVFKLASERRSRPMTGGAIAMFCVAPAASFLALHELSLATVYSSTAITQLLVVFAAMSLFGERYSARQWAGLGFILAGVFVFNLYGT